MKSCFLFHGISGKDDALWEGWLSQKLQGDFEVIFPSFPKSNNVDYHSWFEVIKPDISKINVDTIFVCHSVGCLFAIKLLTQRKIKINKLICVAGFEKLEFRDQREVGKIERLTKILSPLLLTDYEKQNIKNFVKSSFAIYSDNDHLFYEKNLIDFAKSIGASRIYLKNRGHFGTRAQLKELPEVLDLIETISNK